jgi:hypothetical protein
VIPNLLLTFTEILKINGDVELKESEPQP